MGITSEEIMNNWDALWGVIRITSCVTEREGKADGTRAFYDAFVRSIEELQVRTCAKFQTWIVFSINIDSVISLG